jgi:hypothetical protein
MDVNLALYIVRPVTLRPWLSPGLPFSIKLLPKLPLQPNYADPNSLLSTPI